MAKNPHTWSGPTSWQHSGKVDKSGPDKNLSAHGRPTDVKATGMGYFAPTPTSGSGYKSLGHGGSSGIGAPYAMSSDRSEKAASFAKPGKINKSMPDVPDAPKKWHRRGYSMMEGAHGSLAEADKFNAKEKAR